MSEGGASDEAIGWRARVGTGLKCALVAPMVVAAVIFLWTDGQTVLLLPSGKFDGDTWSYWLREIVVDFETIVEVSYTAVGPLGLLVGIVLARRLRRYPLTRRDHAIFAMVGIASAVVPFALVDVRDSLLGASPPRSMLAERFDVYLMLALAGGCAGGFTAWVWRRRRPDAPRSR